MARPILELAFPKAKKTCRMAPSLLKGRDTPPITGDFGERILAYRSTKDAMLLTRKEKLTACRRF